MSTTIGPFYAHTVASNNGNGGAVAWTNPTNAQGASDGSNAAASVSGGDESEYLYVSAWRDGGSVAPNVPSGATVEGFQVKMRRSIDTASGTRRDAHAHLTKSGSPIADDIKNATDWPGSPTQVTYGATNYLGGTTWTVAEANGVGFVLSVTRSGSSREFRVDDFELYITYTAASGSTVNATGTLNATGTPSGTVQMKRDATATATASSDMSTTPLAKRNVSGTVDGAATLTGTTSAIISVSVAAGGTGSLDGTAIVAWSLAGNLPGSGTLTVAAGVARRGAGTLTAAATFSGTGGYLQRVTGTLTTTGTLAGTPSRLTMRGGSFSGLGTLDGTVKRLTLGAGELDAAATFEGTARTTPEAALDSLSTLAGTPSRLTNLFSTMACIGDMSGDATVNAPTGGTFLGRATFVGTAQQINVYAAAGFTATSTLSATALQSAKFIAGGISGAALLSAIPSVFRRVVGELPASGDWRATVQSTLIVSAGTALLGRLRTQSRISGRLRVEPHVIGTLRTEP